MFLVAEAPTPGTAVVAARTARDARRGTSTLCRKEEDHGAQDPRGPGGPVPGRRCEDAAGGVRPGGQLRRGPRRHCAAQRLLRHLLRDGGDPEVLPPAAEAYLRTRGLSDADLALLRAWCVDCESEKCIAARLDRNYQTVRTQFKRIRDLLGAKTQGDLARILGVLSCFAQRYQL
jgi:DNA-binding CsgD family transcriptional regulator